MPAPDSIKRLVDNFEQNKDAFLSPHYKEAQLREDFLDTFFEALGWQLKSIESVADAFRDVIIESSVRVEGSFKAPDYAFRIGPVPKFFVEAKKPFINLEKDTSSAFQVRSYAWSAKLPVSILTDFEEFAVYDCRNRPDRSDSAATGRIKLLNYKEYLTRWDEVEGLFSRKAVWAGKLDEWIKNSTGKKGTLEVDDAFLQEIEKWRDLLARNLALRNPGLSTRELNYAVQMTIDRIIFLRICEDRQIEPEDRLKDICSGEGIYPELVNLFRQADARYNSGLFHFNTEKGQSSSPDDLTPTLSIDDKVLKEIVSGLYYPSPYVFRVLPADILGQVYERFLGKVIRLTAGHQAKVEEKPEVRKAGGVYYTPTYIVEYIVKNTVGKLLENKTPAQAASLKIVDPACGSGSFLLGAYQFLLDWHTKWYSDNQPEKWCKGRSPAIYQTQGGWRLTTAEKKKILLDNIHGVDIDPQAVEVTKLSLSLKVLEGESQETINSQLSLFKERALPDLAKNIQCGNSLIGSDYNEGKLFSDEEERSRVNPFDWQIAFPDVFAQGGFDAVIGNPPYIRIHNLIDYYPIEVKFIQSHYSTASFGKVDIYVAFVEKGIQVLKETGRLGFIVPNKFMQADYGVGLRKLLYEKQALTRLIDFGNSQVFDDATTYTCLLFLSKNKKNIFEVKFNKSYESSRTFLEEQTLEDRKIDFFGVLPWQAASSTDTKILDKLESIPTRLSDVLDSTITGVKTGSNSIFVFELLDSKKNITTLRPEDTDDEVILESKYLLPYLKAESLKRYHIGVGSRLLLYPYYLIGTQTRLVPESEIRSCKKTWEYLLTHKHDLEQRQKGKLKGPNWYGLSFSSSLQMFSSPKIVTPTLSPRNSFSLDTEKNLFPQGAGGGCGLVPKRDFSVYYLLGLLNSKLLTFYFQRISSPFQSGWFAYEPRYLARIPIRIINPSSNLDKSLHEKIDLLVSRILELHRRSANIPQEKDALQREIAATDKQIDNLVYRLYGLTPEEIKIVEGS